jgi:hypothetical protein
MPRRIVILVLSTRVVGRIFRHVCFSRVTLRLYFHDNRDLARLRQRGSRGAGVWEPLLGGIERLKVIQTVIDLVRGRNLGEELSVHGSGVAGLSGA